MAALLVTQASTQEAVEGSNAQLLGTAEEEATGVYVQVYVATLHAAMYVEVSKCDLISSVMYLPPQAILRDNLPQMQLHPIMLDVDVVRAQEGAYI